MKSHQTLLAVSAAVVPTTMAAKSLLPTPPMGFNNWARFECALNQTLFTETADAMVSTGLLAAGYDRINIDDCWPVHDRSSNNSLQWNSTLFPEGIPWLASYVKSRGFHLGIYSDAGNLTCGGYPGSLGFEEIDAATFEEWGIDYLKLDGCNVDPFTAERYRDIYSNWHNVIGKMDNPLIFSESAPAYFSDGGDSGNNFTDWYDVMDWVPLYGELARHSYDIAVFDDNKRPAWKSIMTNYGYNTLVARYQRPGYYNDPDFLIADHPTLSLTEKKSHFALWCSFSAPLIISAWIPGLGKDELEYLKNERLIAVNQDRLALQATLVSQDGRWDVLTKSLSDGDRLLTVLNRQNSTGDIFVPFDRIGYSDSAYSYGSAEYNVTDLWTGKSQEGVTKGVLVKGVPSHGTQVYRISPLGGSGEVVPTGMVFNTRSRHCLSARKGTVSIAACNASDGQVWRFNTKDGSIRNLASLDSCLSADGDKVAPAACDGSDKQKWSFQSTGNIKNAGASGNCLTEGDNGSVSLAACGVESNTQVFEMPSGSLSE